MISAFDVLCCNVCIITVKHTFRKNETFKMMVKNFMDLYLFVTVMT